MNFLKGVDFKNKKVLIRTDFNVPLDKSLKITDNSRLVAALPTINYVLEKGGSPILISHLGRPKGKDKKLSLLPVSKNLSSLLNRPVIFINNCVGNDVKKRIDSANPGSVFLLENLRFYKEEVCGDMGFSKKLSLLADVYLSLIHI